MTRPTRLLSQQSQDQQHARIYMDSMDKLRAMEPKRAVPSLGVRWLCARYGLDAVIEGLNGEGAAQMPDAVLHEVRFCVSWLSDKLVRMPPPLEALPGIWDDIKTLHVCSFDPDVQDRIVKILARLKKRAAILATTSKMVN